MTDAHRLLSTGAPFEVHVPDATLADLAERLARARWPSEPAASGWRYGAKLDYVQRFVERWRGGFDWRAWEERINRFTQRLIPVEGYHIHTLIEPGSGDRPAPLILTHGWPGSFLEFIEMIEPLAHPERFGGAVEDAFTVIVPSLPGYGFSSPPANPITPADIARLWSRLAVEQLGLPRYFAQGGDWGGTVTGLLALHHPQNLAAIHLNMVGVFPKMPPDPPLTAEEGAWLAHFSAYLEPENAYQRIQGTKPQTLAYALTDSPAGLAGWITEKFHGWTVPGEDRDPPFDMDWLIANVMLYWVNGINAANWLYTCLEGDRASITAPPGRRAETPTGLSLFGRDLLPPPPRSWVERVFAVGSMNVFDGGGHFPAMENGPLLTAEIRSFFRAHR